MDIPGLETGTQGETAAECIEMARDAIGLWGICRQDEHRTIPEPSCLAPACDEIVTLVDIDFDTYRQANALRSVRKNVTLPSWLCSMAESAGINFSQIFHDELKARLNVADRVNLPQPLDRPGGYSFTFLSIFAPQQHHL